LISQCTQDATFGRPAQHSEAAASCQLMNNYAVLLATGIHHVVAGCGVDGWAKAVRGSAAQRIDKSRTDDERQTIFAVLSIASGSLSGINAMVSDARRRGQDVPRTFV